MTPQFTLLLLLPNCFAWQGAQPVAQVKPNSSTSGTDSKTRRSLLLGAPIAAITSLLPTIANAAPEKAAVPDLIFTTTPSGLQFADAKPGSTSTPSPTKGQVVSVDYVMSTTGARYGAKIYSTAESGAPYRWTLGDGTTIPGLEEAVTGMTPGGIRRVIIPSKLAYQSTGLSIREECGSKGLGPVPPPESIGEFQRFKNIYCNPDRVYQPDLVMDVKLYGKR